MAQVLAIGKNHFQVVFKSKSESIGEYLHELRTVKEFRKGIPKKIPAIKKNTDILDCIGIYLSSAQNVIKRMKRQSTEWEDIFATYITTRRLTSRI